MPHKFLGEHLIVFIGLPVGLPLFLRYGFVVQETQHPQVIVYGEFDDGADLLEGQLGAGQREELEVGEVREVVD